MKQGFEPRKRRRIDKILSSKVAKILHAYKVRIQIDIPTKRRLIITSEMDSV